MVHMDLLRGLEAKRSVLIILRKERKRMASLRPNPCWQNMPGSLDLLRYFVFLSLIPWALSNLSKQTREARPDCIEVLPGVMPKIIRKITGENKTPLIAGGLISDKEDVCMHWMPGQLPSHLQMRRYGFCKYGGYWEKYICIR